MSLGLLDVRMAEKEEDRSLSKTKDLGAIRGVLPASLLELAYQIH